MNELPYNIDDIRKLCNDDTIIITKHMRKRCIERNITYDDIFNAIMNGEIIEKYADDYPFPSCLIKGNDADELCIHVVLSTDKSYLYIITAYYPNKDKWENDFKIRK